MPGIGSFIREITVEISECEKANIFLLSKTRPHVLSVNLTFKELITQPVVLMFVCT